MVGHREDGPFQMSPLEERIKRSNVVFSDPLKGYMPLFAYYCGNLTMNRKMFHAYGCNKDDRPLIEYQAPITQRSEMAKEASWFNQTQLLAFYNELLREIPPDKDHYLFDIPKKYTKFVLAGLRLHRANLLKEKGDKFAYEVTFQSFRDLLRTE